MNTYKQIKMVACGALILAILCACTPTSSSSPITSVDASPALSVTQSNSSTVPEEPLPQIVDAHSGAVVDIVAPEYLRYFEPNNRPADTMRSLQLNNNRLIYILGDGTTRRLLTQPLHGRVSKLLYESDDSWANYLLQISDTQYLLQRQVEIQINSGQTLFPDELYLLDTSDGSLVPANKYYGYSDDYTSDVEQIDDLLYFKTFSYVNGSAVYNLYRRTLDKSIQKLDTPTIDPYADVFVTTCGVFIYSERTLYAATHDDTTFKPLLTLQAEGYTRIWMQSNFLFINVNLDEPQGYNYILKIDMQSASVERSLSFSRHDELVPYSDCLHVIKSSVSDGSDGRELGSISFTQFSVVDWDGNHLHEYPPLEHPGLLWEHRYTIKNGNLYYIGYNNGVQYLACVAPLSEPT